MRIIDAIPWQAKFGLEFLRSVFSFVPKKDEFFRILKLFRHGAMDQEEYAYKVFKKHYSALNLPRNAPNFTMLELGPGDSLFSALSAYGHSASKSYFVDVGNIARNDLQLYRHYGDYLKKQGLVIPNLTKITSMQELLTSINAEYLTAGLHSLKAIPNQSIDLIWSHAVLEHVERKELLQVIREFRRIISQNGILSHVVDLRDHLGGGLNHLRIPSSLWESAIHRKFGVYTNRFRYSQMIFLFQQEGFEAIKIHTSRWKQIPIKKSKIDPTLHIMQERDLLVAGFDVVMRPKLK